MPIPILMPALSPTMEEGTLAKWLVKEGDSVSAGDIIAEIETDKATMEVEAVDEGTIGKILLPEGTEGVAVNKAIAFLLEEGEDVASLERFSGGEETAAMPISATGFEPTPATTDSGYGGQSAPMSSVTPLAASSTAAARMNDGSSGTETNAHPAKRIMASPLARRLAKLGGIDLSQLNGSGPHGRIVKRDIDKVREAGLPSAPISTAQVQASVGDAQAIALPEAMPDEKVKSLYEQGTYEIEPHNNMRKIIASRLSQAKLTIPHFYLSVECQLDELLSARKRMNEAAAGRFKLSVNDFIIKALGLALQRVPDANATWTEQGMLKHQRSDVGVAVAVNGGLFTPIIRHADLKTLSEISNEMKDLADRARKHRLAPHEYQGGTTSISNLGMFGIKQFDAVINPPHATILAVGMAEQRVVVVDGQPAVATVMSCTLSCDHRVVDGALGAELLSALKAFLEDPVRMLM